MNKPIVIPCNSYFDFATEMLHFQGNHKLKYKEIHSKQKTYLLLSPEIPDHINIHNLSTQHSTFSSTLSINSINPNICYSFQLRELNQMHLPYEYIASIILSLPYTFTKVAHHHDIYGNELLILHN